MGLACFLTGTFLRLRYHQDGMFSETWQRLTFAAAGLQPKTKTPDRAVIFNFWNRLASRTMSMALRRTLKRNKGKFEKLRLGGGEPLRRLLSRCSCCRSDH